MTYLPPQVRAHAPAGRLRGMSRAHENTTISLPFHALQQWHGALQQAFAHSEGPGALAWLAAAISQLVGAESMLISLERKGLPPQLLYQQGIPDRYHEAVLER
ncbi:hypothetical protein, partial [Citrobacter cronae]|uniref:hypothetical protein n=1 Tax=Citrobacter cronae TaxID=1748967 RepID=UPI001C552883